MKYRTRLTVAAKERMTRAELKAHIDKLDADKGDLYREIAQLKSGVKREERVLGILASTLILLEDADRQATPANYTEIYRVTRSLLNAKIQDFQPDFMDKYRVNNNAI